MSKTENELARDWYHARFGVEEEQPEELSEGMVDIGRGPDGRPRILPESPNSGLPSVREYEM